MHQFDKNDYKRASNGEQPSLSTQTRKDQAYHHIRSKILNHLLGPGDRVSHRELAKEIGVSFTPVREAINQLTSEGLLECSPQRGTFVAELTRQDIREVYDIREAQESHAAAKIAGKTSEVDLAEMERLVEDMQRTVEALEASGNGTWPPELADRWQLADAGFHLAILRAAGNRRALKMVGQYRVMTTIFAQRKTHRPKDDLNLVTAEHATILAAIRAGDADKARSVMAAHIGRGRDLALEAFDRNRIERAAGGDPWIVYPQDLEEQIEALE